MSTDRVAIDYDPSSRLPILHSYGGILHPVGSRHRLDGNRSLADHSAGKIWEVVEHRGGVAFILPEAVVADLRRLGVAVTAPWPGGLEGTKEADRAELISNNGQVVAVEVVREGSKFTWLVAG